MIIFVIAAAVSEAAVSEAAVLESCVDDHDEVSLLQLRRKDLVDASDATVLWPQEGPTYQKCSDPSGHVTPNVTSCGERMVDIKIAGKQVIGEYYQKDAYFDDDGVFHRTKYEGGPDVSLRYLNVTTYDGVDLDLLVYNMNDDYQPGLKQVNQGLRGEFGVVSVRANHKADFKFALVDHGTSNEHAIPELAITLYDIDGAEGCAMREAVFATGYIHGKVGANLTNITEFGESGFINAFAPEMREDASVDTPMSPTSLEDHQKRISASFVFADTHSFNVKFD